MISKLNIHRHASYIDNIEIVPTEVNYFFGSNGSGKTTLGKVIANESAYKDCKLHWRNDLQQTLVYNKDFIKDNFEQNVSLKGIFTLGKTSKEAEEFISVSKEKVKELKRQIEGLKTSKGLKEEDNNSLTQGIITKCWVPKGKYQNEFRIAYTGYMGSSKSFFEKCISEKNNLSLLNDWETIKEKCDRIYNDSNMKYLPIPDFEINELLSLEENTILSTKIIGKEDVEISSLINKLNNSDWVKNGLIYLKVSDDKCPFCQEIIKENFRNEIEDFFDETYLKKCNELSQFKSEYENYLNFKIGKIKEIISEEKSILNFDEINKEINLIEEKFKNNILLIDSKIVSPSICIELGSLTELFQKTVKSVKLFQDVVTKNNSMVDNLSSEKSKLTSEVWKFVTNELSLDLSIYEKAFSGNSKALSSLQKSIDEKTKEKDRLEKLIKERESEMTSVIHTVNEINKILVLFGFTNFKISQFSDIYYQIVREDGSEVKETLSEGEYTFITFLYFYHLIKGSVETSGLAEDKIVVIDDPVSSLDSNVLFVVSNMIKDLVGDCLNNRNGISQLFIMTHNVYFFKEVTFKGSRETPQKKESFWIIRKNENKTKIILHNENPIQSTYELLWRELLDTENINKVTIFNTLRRILEYYFNIIGGLNYERCINEFEGEEKIICKSLVSWINDGSHFINDDLVVYVEPETISKYIKIFESIFDKMGHLSHYNMMMKIAN